MISARPEHCLAVLIGINEYERGIPPLRNAVRDVQAVGQLLAEQHGYEVRLVLDRQATLAGLRTLFSGLAAEVSSRTRLLLYFAGHGIAEQNGGDGSGLSGFFIPQDAARDEPATFLPMVELRGLIAQLPCSHLLVMLDCCFAGAFRWSQTRSLRPRPATLYRERYERYLRDSARQVIASAADDERALDLIAGGKLGRRDGDLEHSPFANALCRGLAGAADLRVDGQPGDGVIVANELHVYLETAFERLEQQLGRALQKPLLWSLSEHDKGQFVFLVPGRSIALPSALALVEENNPYRGLSPYEEKNAGLFFGRSEVVEQLFRQVEAQPLTVVSGVSGSGKSSVIRAGLLSRLRPSSDWRILPLLRPGNSPLSALAGVLTELGAVAGTELAAAVATWQAQNTGIRLLLVIDQLEELVTMGASATETQNFLGQVQAALVDATGPLHVVMSLRSDFEPHFAELFSAKPGAHLRFLIRPLSRAELRQVVEGPASERVLYFEPPALVDEIIDEVSEMPGALPLLSFTMSELYRAYVRGGQGDRCLRGEDYQRLGGVSGALSQRADEIFASFDSAHQATLRRVLLRMVSLQAGEVARRRVPRSELRYADGDPEVGRIKMVLDRLQDARLVVSGQDNDGEPYVEPAHDKLILGWPLLHRLLATDREAHLLQQTLRNAAEAWHAGGRQSGLLWVDDPRRPLVLALHRQQRECFNVLELTFIRQSQRRRWISIGMSIAIGLLFVLGLITWGLRERNNAQKQMRISRTISKQASALNGQLMANYLEIGRSINIEEKSPWQALPWLAKSYYETDWQRNDGKRYPGPRNLPSHLAGSDDEDTSIDVRFLSARSARLPVFDTLPFALAPALRPVDSLFAQITYNRKTDNLTFGPESDTVLIQNEDRSISRWRLKSMRRKEHVSTSFVVRVDVKLSPDNVVDIIDKLTGEHLISLRTPSPTKGVALSPNGQLLLTYDRDHVVQVWGVEKLLRFISFQEATPSARNPILSRDKRLLAAPTADGSVWLWALDQPQRPLAHLSAHRQGVSSVAFNRSGSQLLTTGQDGTAKIWETTGWRLLLTIEGKESGAAGEQALFGPTDSTVLTLGSSPSVKVWDAATGTEISKLLGHQAKVGHVAFDDSGSWLATASDDGVVKIWDTKAWQPRHTLNAHRGQVLALASGDGYLLTAGEDHNAKIWQIKTGAAVVALEEHQGAVTAARFAEDCPYVVTGSTDHIGRIWSIGTWTLNATLVGHTGKINDIDVSSDCRRIVTASDDGSAIIWDARTAKAIDILESSGHPRLKSYFTLSDEYVVTVNMDRKIRLWDTRPEPRSGDYVLKLLQCRVPYELKNGALVPRVLDQTVKEDCTHLQEWGWAEPLDD